MKSYHLKFVHAGFLTFRLDLSRTTKNTTIKTSDDDSPAHVTVNGFTENKTIQTSSIPQIRNIQTTPVEFRLGIEEISLPTH
jgi:ribosomal protein S3AE